MKTNLLLLALVAVSLCRIATAEEPRANPQAKLETAIPDMIRLLEAKDHAGLIKTYASPNDLKKILKEKTVEDLGKEFGESHAAPLLKILKKIQTATPKLEDEGARAIYKLEAADMGRDTIVFEKIDQKWYIKN